MKVKTEEGIKEVLPKHKFTYLGRLWIIHKSTDAPPWDSCPDLVVTDFLTGYCIPGACSPYAGVLEGLAKRILDKNKDYDFSQFEAINKV